MPEITAMLDKIRARRYRNGAMVAESARLSDAAAEDIPRLIAAVEAALALHPRQATANGIYVCGTCSREDGETVGFLSCRMRQAVTSALNGGTDG